MNNNNNLKEDKQRLPWYKATTTVITMCNNKNITAGNIKLMVVTRITPGRRIVIVIFVIILVRHTCTPVTYNT